MKGYQLNKATAQIITDSFDAPVQSITSLMLGNRDRIVGTCISGGNFYRFDTDGIYLGIEYLPSETQKLNHYAEGILDGLGIRTDSDRSFGYLSGFVRLDAQIKCKLGGVPCGKRCLPRGQKCRVSGGGQATLRQVRTKLKSPGAGMAAGLAAAGLVAGAGATAYRGRDEIKKGVGEAKEHIRSHVSDREIIGQTRKAIAQQNMADIEEYKKAGHDMTSEQGIKKAIAQSLDVPESEVDNFVSPREVKQQLNAINLERTFANVKDEDIKAGAKTVGTVTAAPGAVKKVTKGVVRAIKKGLTGRA